MSFGKNKKVHAACYPSAKNTALMIIGLCLIGVGALLILLCVPCWAWLAAIGALLILLGFLLVKK